MFYGVLMETIGISVMVPIVFFSRAQSKKQVQCERKAHQISQSDK